MKNRCSLKNTERVSNVFKEYLTLICTETGFDVFDPPFSAALKDIEYLFEYHKRHGMFKKITKAVKK